MVQKNNELRGGDVHSPESYVRSLLDHADIGFHRNTIARLHMRLGDWFATADFLGRAVAEIDKALAANEWTVLEEQVVTGRLSLALDSASASLAVPSNAPLGLLAALPGEKHRLGLSITHLCLRSVGFDTLRVAPSTSAKELVSFIGNARVALVVLFASADFADQDALEGAYREIAPVCRDRGKCLILGGVGAWPETIDYGQRCRSFEDMREILI